MPRYVPPRARVTDGLNRPLPGARLFFYATGTSTPVPTYRDAQLTIPNTNPVVADGAGETGDIFLTPGMQYRVQAQSGAGVVLWDADPVSDTFPFFDNAGNFPMDGGRVTGLGTPLAAGDAVSLGTNLRVLYELLPVRRISQIASTVGVPIASGATLGVFPFNFRGVDTLGAIGAPTGPFTGFTFPRDATVTLDVRLSCPGANSGRFAIYAFLEGTDIAGDDRNFRSSGLIERRSFVAQFAAKQGDVVDISVYQDNGDNAPRTVGGNTYSLATVTE